MKFSQVSPNASPALIDYLMGVTSGNVDFRVTITNLVALIMKSTLLNNPYKFSAYDAISSTSIANATIKVPMNTKNFDTSSNFDATTNYRFTAPVSGFYFFQAQVWMGSAGAGTTENCTASIYKNGSAVRESERINGNGDANRLMRPKVQAFVQLSAGDYVEVYAQFIGSRDIVGSQADTYFDGFLVSAT